jgi:hypothetical protein
MVRLQLGPRHYDQSAMGPPTILFRSEDDEFMVSKGSPGGELRSLWPTPQMLLTSRGHLPARRGRRCLQEERVRSVVAGSAVAATHFPVFRWMWPICEIRIRDSVEGKSRKRARRGRTHMRTGRGV